MIGVGRLRLDLDLAAGLDRRFRPDAVVLQQDRNLVMGSQEVLDLDVSHDLDAAYRAISQHKPLPLGRYLVVGPRDDRSSWTYEAVVHDLEMVPTCLPGDVRRSMTAVLEDAAKRGLSSLAVEPLGVFGDNGLELEEMVDAFDAVVMEISCTLATPLHVRLLLSDMDQVERVSHLLRSKLLRQAARSFRTVTGDAAVVEVRRDAARLHFRFVPGSLSGYVVNRVPAVV